MTNTTRLAPSPTGALHLGNARSFLVNWLLARQNGWRIALRIEDLDGPRIKRDAEAQCLQDLNWLGLDWDFRQDNQSVRSELYNAAVRTLLDQQRAYPCVCTRREIEQAASAPHAEDGADIYPGTCRHRFASIEEAIRQSGRSPAIRFRVDAGEIRFHDEFAGDVTFDPQKQLGDFVVYKSDGTAAYQLAVVVDDHAAGVTHIVRGDDLIDSTPRQLLLYRALGFAPEPRYWHLPLIVGEDGRRLAKRHGDTRISFYRETGTPPGKMLALLARWSGIDCDEQVSIDELLKQFDVAKMPRSRVIFTARDDRFLRHE